MIMASSVEYVDLLSKKKREHLRQLEKLRREATKAERECRLQAASFHHRNNNNKDKADGDEDNLSSLDVEIKLLSTEREVELKRLCQQLTAAKIGVKKFKETVAKSKRRLPASPAVMEDLRSKMVEIESSISSFKSKQKSVYDDLNRHEVRCGNEVASLEKKMVAWEQQGPPVSARGGGAGGAASTRLFPAGVDGVDVDLPAAVIAFEKFQRQSGGVCGGWNEEDHSIFLRVRQKHKGKCPAFIEEASPLLAPRSAQDIQSHEEWFREHEILSEAKREAIEEWRKGKLVKQKEESDSYRATEEEEREKRRRAETDRREWEEKERMRKEAEVTAWKEAKQVEKTKEARENKLAREAEAKKEEAEATRKAKIKAKAEDFAREREEAKRVADEAEAKKERIERERKRKTAAEEILRFQERDQMSVAQRIVFNQRRADEEAEKAKRLEKIKESVAVKVERDPERLVKLTRGMEERKRAKEEEEEEAKRRSAKGVRNDGSSCNVGQIPHRATPSWRAGV